MTTALVLASDDNFVAYASVVARRVALLSSADFPIVILSDGISEENKRLAQKFCSRISFIEAGPLLDGRAFRTDQAYSRAVYLRLFMDEILADFERVAYLDCDLSPLADPAPLLSMIPKASPVMATYGFGHLVHHVYDRLPLSRDAGYLQSGVQVFDLRGVREERIFKDALGFVIANPDKCRFPDQDALNVALQGRWQVIDWRWNVLYTDSRQFPPPFFIRHHAGPNKPWSPYKHECEPHLLAEWREDLAASPWPQRFEPEKKLSFYRRRIRPVTKAIEKGVKAAVRGDEERQHLDTYLKRLPGILKRIEHEAREGMLSRALY